MKLTLTPKDVESFANFEKAVKKQFPGTYVGTDYMVVTIDYPEIVRENLRPYPKNPIIGKMEFDL